MKVLALDLLDPHSVPFPDGGLLGQRLVHAQLAHDYGEGGREVSPQGSLLKVATGLLKPNLAPRALWPKLGKISA